MGNILEVIEKAYTNGTVLSYELQDAVNGEVVKTKYARLLQDSIRSGVVTIEDARHFVESIVAQEEISTALLIEQYGE